MKYSDNITILGDGGWGTTLAVLMSRKGYKVRLWGAFPDYVAELCTKRENYKFLKGVKIPAEVDITASAEKAFEGADIIFLAVPSRYLRHVLTRAKHYVGRGQLFVSVSKGIENDTLMRMSEVVGDVLGVEDIAAVSGPTIAMEIAAGMPATLVASSLDESSAKKVQAVLMAGRLRIYTSPDIIGVELGGALKNIIAIAAGICDGMGLGTNAKAALMTRGLAEMIRLGVAMGANRETFSGLSGMGDLITTCMSRDSRNRWFGEQLGKGSKAEDVERQTEMAVEGVPTTKSAYQLAEKYSVEMPITEEIYRVIYEKKDPKRTAADLMGRSPKPEIW